MNVTRSIALSGALSGANAATLRLEAAASNIANRRSLGAPPGVMGPVVYTPLRVEQVAIAGGGVGARLAPVSHEALLAYDPSIPFASDAGLVSIPNIDPMGEFLDLLTARHDFAANLQVLRASDEMMDATLSMFA